MKKGSIGKLSEACNNSRRYTRSLRISSGDKCVKTHHLRRWNSIHHENSGLICSCHAQRIHRIFKVDNSDQMLSFAVTRPVTIQEMSNAVASCDTVLVVGEVLWREVAGFILCPLIADSYGQ